MRVEGDRRSGTIPEAPRMIKEVLEMARSGKVSSTEDLKADVAVIGGGGAGLAAAVAAAEEGAKVIILEKLGVMGGNGSMTTGLFATETRLQERLSLFVRTDDAFKLVMDYSHLEIDPRIMRAFLEKSGDTIRWLEEKGIEFDGATLFFGDAPLPVFHCPVGGTGGRDIVNALVKNGRDLGVRVLTDTRVTKIVKDKKGRVTGVLAAAKGKKVAVAAKTVIIATGGHGSNKRLLKKYHDTYSEDLIYMGLPHSGDGVMLANGAGANTGGWGTLMYHGPMFPLPIHRPGGIQIQYTLRQPYTVWVNRRGQRFVDEACRNAPVDTANALHQQPGKVCWSLFDESIKRNTEQNGFKRGGGYKIRPGMKPTDLDKEFQLQTEMGFLTTAHSWAEIAQWVGAAPDALEATIDEYNHFCDHGYDKDFLKDRLYLLPLRTPPYYAIRCVQTFLDTIGGIKINHFMEVLDLEDNTIPGLYAVGVTTGGWQPRTYCLALAGNAFGFAINSGRIAGENAAKYIRGHKS
jgi:fumarate reductase flavoprotein subunit